MIFQKTFSVQTSGRGTYELTGTIQRLVRESRIALGVCHVFVRHTSASLMLCENADPTVRTDLERFMGKLAPDGDPMFRHDLEGPDDMPAHVRAVLTGPALSIPVSDNACLLGTWQGVYLWEHRTTPHHRNVVVTVHGE